MEIIWTVIINEYVIGIYFLYYELLFHIKDFIVEKMNLHVLTFLSINYHHRWYEAKNIIWFIFTVWVYFWYSKLFPFSLGGEKKKKTWMTIFDSIVIFISSMSFILCLRSICRAHNLKKVSTLFLELYLFFL